MNTDNLHKKIKMLERELLRKESEINMLKIDAMRQPSYPDLLHVAMTENTALRETIKRLGLKLDLTRSIS